MLYIDHGKGGAADVMNIAEGPVPQAQAGEVVIEVHYAGVNRPDVLQRSGSYPPPPGASPVLGLEVAGRISAVAADVKQWKAGDMVVFEAGLHGEGQYREIKKYLDALARERGKSSVGV